MICDRCEQWFPVKIKIDNIERNLSHRKLCFDCYPFKNRENEYQSWKKMDISIEQKVCIDCGKPIKIKSRCSSCSVSRTRKKKMKWLIFNILGGKCMLCQYGGELKWRALEMHHVNKKMFNVNDGSMGFGWDKIIDESKKCILVCCNCHKEIHLGMMKELDFLEIKRLFWEEKEQYINELFNGKYNCNNIEL